MKKTNAKILASLLRRFARELEALSDDELEELDESRGPLLAPRSGGARRRSDDANTVARSAIDGIIGRLRMLKARDEGVALLKQMAPTKEKLTVVAKALDLPVGKKNSNDEIAEKIVETTIGYRIRSAAIRGAFHDTGASPHGGHEASGEHSQEATDSASPAGKVRALVDEAAKGWREGTERPAENPEPGTDTGSEGNKDKPSGSR
ncbi:hypothetical protein [Burkholderia cepacia]|uniref:hypothetical protein n=1 Tax=Burkholderia cepacia TaxID=292 RepID=UPI002FE015F0